MIWDFCFFGIMGWTIEILWTGLISFVKGDRRLMGYTYLYMFFIYGCMVFAEPLFVVLGNANFIARGLVYMVCIFAAEYVSGYLLERYAGVCPWDYSNAKYNIDGYIRLDYALAWFMAGLIFEKAYMIFLA